MSKEIVAEIADRDAFFFLLSNNPGLIILKFGAKWCGPCKLIEPAIHGFFASSPNNVLCGDIDVDVSFDVYAFLKSKKMVHGIPAVLCYKRGNATFIPDDSTTGSDPEQLHQFFIRCGNHLQDVLINHPVPSSGRR